MVGIESIIRVMNLYYGNSRLLNYSESDDEIRFEVPTPIRDTQTAVFRSREGVLNELAVSHRFSLLIGRGKYGVSTESAFAIKSVQTTASGIDPSGEYEVSLRFEVISRRQGVITALRSTLVTKYGVEANRTITSFRILSPSLAHFVRRGRQFIDFADVKISRDKSCLSTVADKHFRYHPSEDDRLSDGERVDHVPALTLIDIALFVNRMAHQETVYSNIAADFLSYTDPRLPFDIVQRIDQSVIEFVQHDQLVATVCYHECPGSSPN